MSDAEDPGRVRTIPRWMRGDEDARRGRVKSSRAHEKRIAKAIQGKVLPGSGNRLWTGRAGDTKTQGADVDSRVLRVEHKFVQAATKSYGVTRQVFAKIVESARSSKKVPALVITFEGAQAMPGDWICLPLDVAVRLLQLTFEDQTTETDK